jgi:hypothetical protein
MKAGSRGMSLLVLGMTLRLIFEMGKVPTVVDIA